MEIKGWGLCVGVSRRGANLAKEGHNAQKWVRPGSKFSWAQAWVWSVRQVFGCKIALYLFDDFCRQLLRKMKVAILVLALVAFVHADMYLHNPRLVCMCTVNSILWAQLVASMYVIYIYFFTSSWFALSHRGSNNRLDEARRDRNNANRYVFFFLLLINHRKF